jgi:hypothetical protein
MVQCILSRKLRTIDKLNAAWFGRNQTALAYYCGLKLNPSCMPKHMVEWGFGNGT